VLGLSNPMLGDGYVNWLLVRVGSDVVWFRLGRIAGCVRWAKLVTCSRQIAVMDVLLVVLVVMIVVVNGND
jgi:hypothetical protein